MVKVIVDRQEVIMLIDLIEAPFAPVDSKMKAIKRLEYILGRDIPGTKEFRKIRDEFTKPVDDKPETNATIGKFGAESHVGRKTKHTPSHPTGRKGRA
jgi:hypothetical protein